MPFSQLESKPIVEQLKVLEDAYAELLMENVYAKTLSQLWNNIKALQRQVNAPIYDYVTPAELRQ